MLILSIYILTAFYVVFYEFLYFENCMSFKNVYAYQNQLVLQCTFIFQKLTPSVKVYLRWIWVSFLGPFGHISPNMTTYFYMPGFQMFMFECSWCRWIQKSAVEATEFIKCLFSFMRQISVSITHNSWIIFFRYTQKESLLSQINNSFGSNEDLRAVPGIIVFGVRMHFFLPCSS